MKKFLSIILTFSMLCLSFGMFNISAKTATAKIQAGDVDASFSINNKDLGLFMQYLNGWDVTNFHTEAADVAYDDVINNKDYALLMQYVNGWAVTLGNPAMPPYCPPLDDEENYDKTIKFITTIDPKADESGPVIENFEKEYRIKVEIIPSGLDEHVQKCMGLIAAGQSPDVARSSGDYPAFMGYLQSLDAAKLDYSDPIWNQNTFKMSTFGGSPYLCDTVCNIWTELDIVMYSKSLLKRANSCTPEEYDKLGRWTWDAFFQIGKSVQKLTGESGCAINSYETFYHAAGGSIYKIENGKIVNGMDNKTVEIMIKYSQARKDKIIMGGKSVTAGLMEGDIGIATLHAWSLKKTGDLKNANWNDLGFYYLPYYDEADAQTGIRPMTGIFRGWGICKGANEPVAAGLFLREYLDVNNYDVGGTYITPEAETFFFKITSSDYDNYNPYLTYIDMNQFISGINSSTEIYQAMYYDPSQVATNVAASKSAVDKGVKNLNAFIEQNMGAH